jgi:hypothetical protein
MTYLRTSAYTAAYRTARSSLAALARLTPDEDACRFGQMLIELDQIHCGDLPAIYPLSAYRRDLLLWLEGAIEQMIVLGGDAPRLESVLAGALDPSSRRPPEPPPR